MKYVYRLLLASASFVALGPAMAQDASNLDFDDLIGVWNMTYEGGRTGTFAISRKEDGTPEIIVTMAQGDEGEARDISIQGDTIAFGRNMSAQGMSLRVNYTAKLVDGKLEGSGMIDESASVIPAGIPPLSSLNGTGPRPERYTATKAE